MLFVPRYFDFVRVRQLLTADDVPFTSVSEYSTASQVRPSNFSHPFHPSSFLHSPFSDRPSRFLSCTPPRAQVGKARHEFQNFEVPLLVYTERAHFFRRHKLRGARHLAVYSPPSYPHFYTELVQSLNRANTGKLHIIIIARSPSSRIRRSLTHAPPMSPRAQTAKAAPARAMRRASLSSAASTRTHCRGWSAPSGRRG